MQFLDVQAQAFISIFTITILYICEVKPITKLRDLIKSSSAMAYEVESEVKSLLLTMDSVIRGYHVNKDVWES